MHIFTTQCGVYNFVVTYVIFQQIWITLFICLILKIFVWKYLTKNRFTLPELLMKTFRSLVEQGDNNDIRNYSQPGNQIYSMILTILNIIWLFSSLILSKSFAGLLLNTYFNIKPTLVVNTIEDIRNNKEMVPYGPWRSLSFLSKSSNLDIDDIIERMKQFQKDNDLPELIELIENIVDGQTIAIYTSQQSRLLMEVFYSYKNRIFVSDHKYLPNYSVFFVHKNRKYTKIIHY